MISINKNLFAIIATLAGSLCAAPILQTTDFIEDASRTHFNGFEGIADVFVDPLYIEDNIKVEQINADPGASIWTEYLYWGGEGKNAWYPNGGDFGYTRITLADGSDFIDMGLIYGSGGSSTEMHYELYNDEQLVLSGVLPVSNDRNHYFGFSGGGVDEIHLRDYYSFNTTFNTLAIDNIETSGTSSVPESPSSILLIIGLSSLGLIKIRFKKA